MGEINSDSCAVEVPALILQKWTASFDSQITRITPTASAYFQIGVASNLIRVILLRAEPEMLPRAHRFRLAWRTAFFLFFLILQRSSRNLLESVIFISLYYLYILRPSSGALVSAEEEDGRVKMPSFPPFFSPSLSAGTLPCHCEFPQRWQDMEAAGRLINTGIRLTQLNTCVSPLLTSSPLCARQRARSDNETPTAAAPEVSAGRGSY